MSLSDNCGCVACQFIARDPHHPWPPSHVWVELPDGRVIGGTYWPKNARISIRINGRAWMTTKWSNVDRDTVRLDAMPPELLI
jgi:hypothetical protein